LRYRADTDNLGELLGFLYNECCTRNQVVESDRLVAIGIRKERK
jgi:hypothetical protein